MTSNSLPSPHASTSYIPPVKRILSSAHLAAFQRSQTHADIIGFVDRLNESVVNTKLTEAGTGSEVRQEDEALVHNL